MSCLQSSDIVNLINIKAFDIVTESEVVAAQRALASEMSPQITELIDRAENGLETMKKREKTLREKVHNQVLFSS